jgi:hypothetical protein
MFRNPRIRYLVGNAEIGRAHIQERSTIVRLEYLIDNEEFLPVTLADIFFFADPRKQDTPG